MSSSHRAVATPVTVETDREVLQCEVTLSSLPTLSSLGGRHRGRPLAPPPRRWVLPLLARRPV